MTNPNLQVNYRHQKGKSYRKQLARQEMIPGVVYGRAVGSIPVEVGIKPLNKILSKGANSLIDLTINGSGGQEDNHYKVLIKDIQYSAVKHELLSVDLHQISLNDPIQAAVPINFIGKVNDGIEQYVLRELQVSCLPADIPKEIEFNLDGLSVGDTVSVRDIAVPNNVVLVDEPDTTVVTVMAQRVEELPVAETEPGDGDQDEAAGEIPG